MIVKMKSYFLKENVPYKKLEEFGFKNSGNGNYCKDAEWYAWICCYKDTRRFVYADIPYKNAKVKKVKKYIARLIDHELVEIKTNYEWWAIIGRWQNYSQKKKDRIQDKLDKLNKGN